MVEPQSSKPTLIPNNRHPAPPKITKNIQLFCFFAANWNLTKHDLTWWQRQQPDCTIREYIKTVQHFDISVCLYTKRKYFDLRFQYAERYDSTKDPTLSRQSVQRWRQGCQSYAPAALYSPETLSFCSWYSFLLEAEWIPGHSEAGRIT
jgi:hypothetical protein